MFCSSMLKPPFLSSKENTAKQNTTTTKTIFTPISRSNRDGVFMQWELHLLSLPATSRNGDAARIEGGVYYITVGSSGG